MRVSAANLSGQKRLGKLSRSSEHGVRCLQSDLHLSSVVQLLELPAACCYGTADRRPQLQLRSAERAAAARRSSLAAQGRSALDRRTVWGPAAQGQGQGQRVAGVGTSVSVREGRSPRSGWLIEHVFVLWKTAR